MDSRYRPDLPLEDGITLLKLCIQEMSKRFLVNLPLYKVKVIDKDGVRNLPTIRGGDLVKYNVQPIGDAAGAPMEVGRA